MKKQKKILSGLFLGCFIFLQGCAVSSGELEPTSTAVLSESPPTATETVIPPTQTAVPPTSTAIREVISSGNIQRIQIAWNYPHQYESFRSIAFSPDGRILAGGTGQNQSSEDLRVRLWDVSSGQLIAESEHLDAIVWDLAYSPKGNFLAIGLETGIVQLRDPQNLALIRQYYFPGAVNSLAISPDAATLAAGVADNGNGTVYLVDLISGETSLSFWAHPYSIPDLDYSPDGSLLATGAVDRMVKVWDSTTGRLVQSLPQDGQGTAVRFSNDGGLLAAGFCAKSENYVCQAGGVLLWSTTTWDLFRSLSGPDSWLEDLDFTLADDLVAGVDRNGFFYIWRVSDGEIVRSSKISSFGTEAIAISRDGFSIGTGSTYTMGLWNIGQ